MSASFLSREEYIEQAYFFHAMRERLTQELSTQDVLNNVHQEILSTTRLPMAIQFLATELRHSGMLSTGFERLSHYFTPYQTFIMKGTELENHRFDISAALLVLEREAEYRSKSPTLPGLFIYQFEVLCRNRLGYDDGLAAMAGDWFYPDEWKEFIRWLNAQVGVVEVASLIYLRSTLYVMDTRRERPNYEPSLPPLFEEKEGKIAKANQGNDPLYLFAALQRQLGYPEVPRPQPKDDLRSKFAALQQQLKELEMRVKLLESEARDDVDLTQFGKPEIFDDD